MRPFLWFVVVAAVVVESVAADVESVVVAAGSVVAVIVVGYAVAKPAAEVVGVVVKGDEVDEKLKYLRKEVAMRPFLDRHP